MKGTLAVLALMAVSAPPIAAQVEGDSIRLRIPPPKTWTYGRYVSLSDSLLTISHADSNQSYAVQTIGRFEVRRRKNVALTLIGSTVACVAGAGLGILVRPKDRGPLFGSNGADLAVAAGFGLVVGAIDLGISRWRWDRVRLGVRAPS